MFVRSIVARRSRRALVLTATLILAISLAACGGDDDPDTSTVQPVADPTTAATATVGPSGDLDAPGADSDSITTQFLSRFFGLPASFVTDEQRACIDAELAPDFPNGLPADATFTDELIDTIDIAAEKCGVGSLSS